MSEKSTPLITAKEILDCIMEHAAAVEKSTAQGKTETLDTLEKMINELIDLHGAYALGLNKPSSQDMEDAAPQLNTIDQSNRDRRPN